MSFRKNIAINSVLLDAENARHGDKTSQKEIYAWMAGEEIGAKVFKLASEIAKRGNSPIETPAVIPAPEGAAKPWVVVEGNRRIAAFKFMNNPKLCPDAKLRKQYERLKNNAETPVATKIEFVVFENIGAARYWIETRHGGENGGAGIISWGPMEFDNFSARFGAKTTNRPAVELISYALKNGLIRSDQYKEIPVTTLYRLLSTPLVRQILGCDLIKGELYRVADKEYFHRAIVRVLNSLISGEKNVTTLKTKELREGFAKLLKSEGGWTDYELEEPRKVIDSNSGDEEDEVSELESEENDLNKAEAGGRRSKGSSKPSWDRETLFSRNRDGLMIPDDHSKAKNIVAELKRLKTGGSKGTPIAVAMLLRALIEISTTRYKNVFSVKADQDFNRQVAIVADHMHRNMYINDDQHALVLRMSRESESMLHVKTLQKYVHSEAFHPTVDVLNSLWDQISFYIESCWVHKPSGAV